uniref:COP9 signalosome complex subunit 4 n=1 Tax=Heterorhabditis bacteriophora TaxID=37862 RepID=A0A1I7X792_HETBA
MTSCVVAEVTEIFARETDHKAQGEELQVLLNNFFPSQVSSGSDIEPLMCLIEAVSRHFISTVATRLDQCLLPLSAIRLIAERTLNILNSRAISYEEQSSVFRQKLACVHEQEGRFVEAAHTLIGIPVESGQRPFSAEQKMSLYLRIGRLLLEAGHCCEAEQYVNRASLLQAEARSDRLNIDHKVVYARVLDSKRKFIDAAQRYHELSLLSELPVADKKIALTRAISCTILANPAQLPTFGLLEKMYLDKLIKNNEFIIKILLFKLLEFENELPVHQRTDEKGESIVRSVIVEHNMAAVSRLYNNISLETLGQLLGIEAEKAEYIAAQMISTNRLKGRIDQIEGYVHFEKRDPLKLWDEQILSFCHQVNKVTDMITAAHPELSAK